MADAGSTARACSGCGEALGRNVRFCPACGRYAPGARRPYAWVATVTGVAFWLVLIALVYVGYLLVPILGFMAEAAIWTYAILTGDWGEVEGRNVLIGTGIGLALLAVAAVVMRICGAGA
jgi:hypothetical protein